MNIRVDLNTPIYDGMEVVFKAPCDYAEVSRLALYYPTTYGTDSQVFAFADAHANDLAHLDVLFAKDAVVKVILDLSASMAFVQNADTNTYLEGRFDGIINSACPSFEESGGVVVCEPVEGYPLKVTASDEATQIVRCGKNLFDFQQGVSLITYTTSAGAVAEKYGYDIHLPAGTYTMNAYGTHTSSYVYGMVTDADGNTKKSCSLVVGASYTKQTVTIEDGDIIKIYNGVAISTTTIQASNAVFARFDIQIEVGNTATAFEAYHGDAFGVGEDIPALEGVNCLYADKGEITVSGKASTAAIIEKLTTAIIALGGTL